MGVGFRDCHLQLDIDRNLVYESIKVRSQLSLRESPFFDRLNNRLYDINLHPTIARLKHNYEANE